MALVLKNVVVLRPTDTGKGVAQELDDNVARQATLTRLAVKIVQLYAVVGPRFVDEAPFHAFQLAEPVAVISLSDLLIDSENNRYVLKANMFEEAHQKTHITITEYHETW
jgi:hypothetical protein